VTQEADPEPLRDLHGLALELAVARTSQDVCTALVRHVAAATGATEVAAWYLDGAGRTVLGGTLGDDPDAQARRVMLQAGDEVVGALALSDGAGTGELHAMLRLAGQALARTRSVADAQRLASFVDSSAAAMFGLGPDGTILSWNPAAERMTGYSAAEAIGSSALMLATTGALSPPTREATDRIRDGGGPEHLEAELRRKDGSCFHVAMTLSPMRDPGGELTGVSVIARDISSVRQSEQRLRRLAAAMDRSPTAVVVVGREGEIVECTPAAERLLGLARHDALGRPAHFLESGPECGVITPLQESVARGETFLQDPVWRTSPDGTPRRLRVTGYPIAGEGGELSGTVIAMEDVTETTALEEALRRAQRMEALGRLAGGVAHDVNNMLTVIAGYAQIARSHVDDGEGAEALDEVGSATKRVQGLTRRLLAFARRRSVEPARLDLSEVVGGLLPMLRSLVGGTVRVRCDAEPGVPPVRADRAGMEQVIVNLVVNARDAMPDGGEVAIALRGEAGGLVVLEVSDTGGGMTRETAAQIFEPFFSTKDPARTEDGAGTGLGLATVHGTITQAGGDIEVETAPGRGTRFTIRLPADEAGAEPEQDAVPDDEEALLAPRPARILACEDEPAVLHLLRRFLGDAGYEVTAVSDPREALAVAEREDAPFDLLVTDVLMPGMSGPQLADRLVQDHRAGRVVFISGFVDDSFAEPGAEERVLLGKPFTAAELLAAVRAQLDR
jgi:PAS domain S-box-containing protein